MALTFCLFPVALFSYLSSKSGTADRHFQTFSLISPGVTLIWSNAVSRYALSEEEATDDFTVLLKVVVASIHSIPIHHILIRYFWINSASFLQTTLFCEVTRRLDSFCALRSDRSFLQHVFAASSCNASCVTPISTRTQDMITIT